MPLLQKRGTQMPQVSNSIQSFFPARVWGKTSEAPMCSNPNCCSNTSWVEQRNITNLENKQSTGKCTHEQHNKHPSGFVPANYCGVYRCFIYVIIPCFGSLLFSRINLIAYLFLDAFLALPHPVERATTPWDHRRLTPGFA